MSDTSLADWALIGALAVGSTVSLGVLEFTPHDTNADVAVVFAPWVRGGDAAARATDAGASLMGAGRWPFVVIVRPTAADYARHAMGAGALAVVSPKGPFGCFSRRGRSA